MAKTGNWGDKIIITVGGDGIRRHKKWCESYRDGNYCTAFCGKCIGSAFCDHYKSMMKDDGSVFFPLEKKPIAESGAPKADTPEKKTIKSVFREYYRRAGWGDRLIHSAVLVRATSLTFRIGYVTDEDLHTFTVKCGSEKHKYNKSFAFKREAVYIFTEAKEEEETV